MTNAEPDHLAAQLLDQRARRRPRCRRWRSRRRRSGTRSPGRTRVAVDLEQVGAVLEHVLLLLDLPRQLARPCAQGRSRRRSGSATGAATMKPARLDAEDLVDAGALRTGSASASIVNRNASASASSGVMSLKPTPGLGKSGMSRMCSFSQAASRRSHGIDVTGDGVAPATGRRRLGGVALLACCSRHRGGVRRPLAGQAVGSPAAGCRAGCRQQAAGDRRPRPRPASRGAHRLARCAGQALADRRVARLALLEQRQHRRGDEDRRVRPGEQADEQGRGRSPGAWWPPGCRRRRPGSTASAGCATSEVLSDAHQHLVHRQVRPCRA